MGMIATYFTRVESIGLNFSIGLPTAPDHWVLTLSSGAA